MSQSSKIYRHITQEILDMAKSYPVITIIGPRQSGKTTLVRSIFKEKEYRNVQSFVCFAELVGRRSEFGQHDFENDTFDIILFDVHEHIYT